MEFLKIEDTKNFITQSNAVQIPQTKNMIEAIISALNVVHFENKQSMGRGVNKR
jgi:hypothetical protein